MVIWVYHIEMRIFMKPTRKLQQNASPLSTLRFFPPIYIDFE